MKKVIIFDMDGVLVDSIKIAKDALYASYAGMTDEIHQEIMSGNFHEELKKYSHLKKPETEEEKKRRQSEYTETKISAPLYAGVKDLLEKLRKSNYILALNTSAYERNCQSILEKTGTKQYFDFIGTAEVSKSKVEKFKMIEDKYAVNKEEVLFITDTLGDLKEAELANVPTVAVTWGGHGRSFFEREKHPNLIGIVDTVKELHDFIEKN